MAYRHKHFRLSEEVCRLLESRDRDRYPHERDLVTEAVLSSREREDIRQILEEIRAMKESADRLYQSVGWR